MCDSYNISVNNQFWALDLICGCFWSTSFLFYPLYMAFIPNTPNFTTKPLAPPLDPNVITKPRINTWDLGVYIFIRNHKHQFLKSLYGVDEIIKLMWHNMISESRKIFLRSWFTSHQWNLMAQKNVALYY